MKFLFSLLILCLLSIVAMADKPMRYDWDGSATYWTLSPGVVRVADSTGGMIRDTLTFPAIAGATIAHFWIELTSSSSATDSFNVVYRSIPYYTEVDATGSLADTLYFQTETADSAKVIDWTAGNTYRACDFRIYAGQFHQFILLGSAGDNIFYTAHFRQVVPGKAY